MNKMRIALIGLAVAMALIVVIVIITGNTEASSSENDKCSGSKSVYYVDCVQCHKVEPRVENTDHKFASRCDVCHEDMTFNPANGKCTFIDQIYPE